jgi:hypothetical protein
MRRFSQHHHDPIIATLKRANIPVTRENCIELVHKPHEGEWTAEQ